MITAGAFRVAGPALALARKNPRAASQTPSHRGKPGRSEDLGCCGDFGPPCTANCICFDAYVATGQLCKRRARQHGAASWWPLSCSCYVSAGSVVDHTTNYAASRSKGGYSLNLSCIISIIARFFFPTQRLLKTSARVPRFCDDNCEDDHTL